MKGFYALHNKCVTQPSSERLDRNIDEILNVSERKDDKSTFVQLWNFTQLYYSFHCPTLTKVHSNLESMFFRNHRKPKLEAGNSIDYFSSQEHLRLHPQTENWTGHWNVSSMSSFCSKSFTSLLSKLRFKSSGFSRILITKKNLQAVTVEDVHKAKQIYKYAKKICAKIDFQTLELDHAAKLSYSNFGSYP